LLTFDTRPDIDCPGAASYSWANDVIKINKEFGMPIKKIPTVSRRIHPMAIGAAAILLGVAVTAAALLVRAASSH
jgi:hypothetical protein